MSAEFPFGEIAGAANGKLASAGRFAGGKDVVLVSLACDGWVMGERIVAGELECLWRLAWERGIRAMAMTAAIRLIRFICKVPTVSCERIMVADAPDIAGCATISDGSPAPGGRELKKRACMYFLLLAWAFPLGGAVSLHAQSGKQHPSFEILTHRMDVDVDGAPNAYGPPGTQPLDVLLNAHFLNRADKEVVGYLTDEHHRPILQGPRDPFPGYYISQTAFTDSGNPNEADPRRYVDARKINYVVRGNVARRRGVKVGDFVAVYSKRTRRSVFAIVGDTGNPSGDEGSLHLLQDLGYPFRNGTDDSVETAEIVIRFYPNSNPRNLFFFTQAEVDETASKMGLSRDFGADPKSGR